MCGIVAIYGDNASHWAGHLGIMLDRISHRGPDDQGIYVNGRIALGQKRLSIIDVASGRQPIFAEDEISDLEFQRDRESYSDVQISSKEELYYYRIFRHFFSDAIDSEVIGRWQGGFASEGAEL